MRYLVFALLFAVSASQAAVTAKSYIVTDMSGNVIMEQAADEPRAIASITKLITTENTLQQAADELITISSEDVKHGRMRSSPLRAGVSYSRAALVELALVSSDNIAAIALWRASAVHMIPPSITIIEASGLNPENRSSARTLAAYARTLLSTQLAATSVKATTTIGKITKHSTNPLINKPGWQFFLSKTGFINESGGCLVVITMIKEQLRTIVILGSTDTRQRWRDLAELRHQLGDTNFSQPGWPARKSAR